MSRLNLQDAILLKMESAERPFHIAGLVLCSLPPNAPESYLRELRASLRALPGCFPSLAKKLSDPGLAGTQRWIDAEDYDSAYHVFHYGLPQPGSMTDLLELLSRVHERVLDRRRPLWEVHLIEGLEGARFAFYFKFHHAIMDGAGALRMVREIFSQSPTARWDAGIGQAKSEHASHTGIGRRLGRLTAGILEQGRALPELYGLLGNMGVRSWREGDAAPPLPFTGSRTLLNQDISGERCIIITRLSLKSVRKIGTAHGGTINDAILAICGGALRSYLQEQDDLPDKSLFAGVPVSVDPSGEHKGNQLSTIICPLGTNFADPKERIERIVHITRQAKSDLHHVTRAASQNYMNLLLIPSMMLTLAGAASRVPPALNLILSNVPGPERRLYLNGSPVEAIYPLSLISDGGGVNITALSYAKKLCFGIVACPTILPDIERLAEHIKQAHRELHALC